MNQLLKTPLAQISTTHSGPIPDDVLVRRMRDNDSTAYEQIIRRHNQRLFRIARGILRNDGEAEDVVQETYVRAFIKLNEFVGPNGFAAWLGRITINEALGRLRRQARVTSLEVTTGDSGIHNHAKLEETLKAPQPSPEAMAAGDELRSRIESAIDALPDPFRAVFMLRAVEGLSIDQTAQLLSIRPATVKTRYYRARQRLQVLLGEDFRAQLPRAFEFGGARCDRIVNWVSSCIDSVPAN